MFTGLSPTTAWAVIQRQGDALQTRFEARRDITAEVERFRTRAAEIGSIEELLRDRRTLTLVLEAFQLETEVDKRAVVRKLLTESPDDDKSFANRMIDPRYRELNAVFGGKDPNKPPLDDPKLVERIIDQAMVNRFERQAGEESPGLREALYFKRRIGSVKTVPELMSDRAMLEVARVALGFPKEFALLSYEQQRDRIMKRLDMEDFTDPKQVDRFVQRYLVMKEDTSSGPTDPILTLLGGGGGTDLTNLIGRHLSITV